MKYINIYIESSEETEYVVKDFLEDTSVDVKKLSNVHVFTEDELKKHDAEVLRKDKLTKGGRNKYHELDLDYLAKHPLPPDEDGVE